MNLSNDFKKEIIEEMTRVFPGYSVNKVGDFFRLQGADTITYSFILNQDSVKRDLVLRIYREITDTAEEEFVTLQSLTMANISVPKPYFWKKKSPIISKSYLIMEKIPGIKLADCFATCKNEYERDELIVLFIKELAKLHSLNWKRFSFLKEYDLQSNPFAFINIRLNRPMKHIKNYDIEELTPLLNWLEKNKKGTNKLTLIHGDYHMNNVILTPKNRISVIDWASIQLGDNRFDLGFSIVATSSLGKDVTKQFLSIYEDFSGERVKNIEYFMILSSLNYILRCYSSIINPEITKENKTTKNMFFNVYKNYTKYIVELVKKTTEFELSLLDKELS
jgi:aminoglycoside 3'-phosphotransferase-2